MPAPAAPPTNAPSSGLKPAATPSMAREPQVSPQALAPNRMAARVMYLAIVDMTGLPRGWVREEGRLPSGRSYVGDCGGKLAIPTSESDGRVKLVTRAGALSRERPGA